MWRTDGGWEPETMPPQEPLELHLALPLTAVATQIKDASQAWLMRFAKQVFLSRLDRYAPELGFNTKRCVCRVPIPAGVAPMRKVISG